MVLGSEEIVLPGDLAKAKLEAEIDAFGCVELDACMVMAGPRLDVALEATTVVQGTDTEVEELPRLAHGTIAAGTVLTDGLAMCFQSCGYEPEDG